jgi:hypothetical protein
MKYEMRSTASSATNLSIDEPTSAELTRKGKFAIWLSVLSALFFSQIAYNIGDFPVSTEFVCYALTALYLLMSGHASLSTPTLMLYLTAAAFACLTMELTRSPASWSSLLLLFILYAPFCCRLMTRHDLEPIHRYIQSTYVLAATIIAAIAVIQIMLVNGLGASALTNLYFNLPDEIRAAGTYTFHREDGGIIKANGFFLRESADLSIVTALALVIEYFARARWHVLAILAAGLFCSFSGSGISALILAFLMPRSISRVPVFLISSVIVILAMLVLNNLEIPGLTLFFDRFSEFETPGTSGYARFVAPLNIIERNFEAGLTSTWLGNGGGSYLRGAARLLEGNYEVNDPTWAKLIYEYGLVGLILISAIFMIRIYSSALQPEICNFILFVWMFTAQVLKVEFVLLFWLLTIVPQTYGRSVLNKQYLGRA